MTSRPGGGVHISLGKGAFEARETEQTRRSPQDRGGLEAKRLGPARLCEAGAARWKYKSLKDYLVIF